MAVFAGPEIVNDGLVLHLDAANSRSYPGSGTTWFDLAGDKLKPKPTQIKNWAVPITSNWLIRTILTEITDGSITPPFEGAGVFKLEIPSSYPANLHRNANFDSLNRISNSCGYFRYSFYIRGDTNNSADARIFMDLSDHRSANDNVTVGNSTEWVKLSVWDNSDERANLDKFLDFNPVGAAGDIFYLSAMMFYSYVPFENTNLLVPLLSEIDYLDYEETIDVTPPTISYNASLVNSPVFSNGSFELDGASDYIQLDTSIPIQRNTSLETVFKYELTPFTPIVFGTSASRVIFTDEDTIKFYVSNSSNLLTATLTGVSSAIRTNTEFLHMALCADDNFIFHVYINSIFVGSVDLANNASFILRTIRNVTRLSQIRFYDKYLTPEEIKQNFESTRSRYGI